MSAPFPLIDNFVVMGLLLLTSQVRRTFYAIVRAAISGMHLANYASAHRARRKFPADESGGFRMYVRDIMVTEFHCASPGEKISDIAQAMKRHNVGAIPICENSRLSGIITDRDIAIECVSAGLDPKQSEVREFMTVNPITVGPGADLKQAAEIMGREQVRRLPVVEGGKLVGLISLGDLAFHLGDDSAVAELLRRISTPVRAMAAGC